MCLFYTRNSIMYHFWRSTYHNCSNNNTRHMCRRKIGCPISWWINNDKLMENESRRWRKTSYFYVKLFLPFNGIFFFPNMIFQITAIRNKKLRHNHFYDIFLTNQVASIQWCFGFNFHFDASFFFFFFAESNFHWFKKW